MTQKRKREKANSSFSPSRTRKTRAAISDESSSEGVVRSPRRDRLTTAQKERRTRAFTLLRLRRNGMSWHEAEEQSGIIILKAQHYLPKAFFRDSGNRLQVTSYDRYVEALRLPTTHPGKLEIVRARGSRQRSLCGQWLNALQAAGRDDFGAIDAFPKDIF